MKHFHKRLAALALSLCLLALSGCSKAGEGLTLSVCVGADPPTLDPIYAEETGDQTILVHLYENLMRLTADSTGRTAVTGGMAKSVDQEEETKDGTVSVTYTFRLRSARWSDGQAVKAGDFVYAWQRLADPVTASPYADLLSIVSGYEEARITGDMSLLQVTAKNDSTLVVVLDGHYDWFLKEVCTSPATMPLRQDVIQKLKEGEGSWWSDPTKLVTNGPYEAVEYLPGDHLSTRQSDRYYASLSGPRTLNFYFAGTPEQAQSLYQAQTVDVAWPPSEEQLNALAADSGWTALPELKTYSAAFNCLSLQDPLVREALALAIDREALRELAGPAARAAEGLVPPGVPENEEGDFRTVGGPLLDNDPEQYAERCARARALFQEAGYDSGEDLGELEYFYTGGGAGDGIAQALCQQWQSVLQIQVTPRSMTELELWAALRSGEYDLAGFWVTASANDAECFLMDWTSGNPDNIAGYENTVYDTLMEIISITADGTARMGCLHDAEELLLQDYALSPLYTAGTTWDLRDSLAGAFRDPRGWFCFSYVFTRTV